MKVSITEEMQAFLKTYHNAGGGKDAKALFELANYYVGKKDENCKKKRSLLIKNPLSSDTPRACSAWASAMNLE